MGSVTVGVMGQITVMGFAHTVQGKDLRGRESFSLGFCAALLFEVTINSICKCFVVFLYPHLCIKSKTSAYIRHLL